MPTYGWKCDEHGPWDVCVPIADRDNPQPCPSCGVHGTKQLSAPNIDRVASGAWNQQSYNPGLGCWTKSWKHGREIAKARGMEEVGDEPADKLLKAADKKREETRQERWAEADRVKLYE